MRRPRSRRPSLLHIVTLVVAAGCLSDTSSYSPQQDDEAIDAIVWQFSAAGTDGLTLSLCEDVAAVEDSNTCQVAHTVRGGGRGRRHEESFGGIGCGGCPFATVAVVKGTLSGGGLIGTRTVKGEITLGLGINGDDPYGFPYDVRLTCDGTPTPCSLSGTLEADGSLQVTLSEGLTGMAADHALIRGVPASCP